MSIIYFIMELDLRLVRAGGDCLVEDDPGAVDGDRREYGECQSHYIRLVSAFLFLVWNVPPYRTI